MTTELDCSVGLSVAEADYGTATTVSKHLEFTEETLGWDPTFVQGAGLRVGSRVQRSGRRKLGKQQGAGDVTLEAVSKGMGALLQSALGVVTTTQRATTGVYQQNHKLALTDPLISRTIQKGIPPIGGGATSALTFLGSMCSGLEFTLANADKLMLKTSWLSREIRSDVDYAAPSYPTPLEMFSFIDGQITIGGTVTPATTTEFATGGTAVADIRDWSLAMDNGLDDGGFNIGAAGKRSRPAELGLAAITGKLTAEYDNNTLRDAYLDQADLALVMTFLGSSTIGTGSDVPGLQIVVNDIRLSGDLPKSNGGEPVTLSIDYEAFDNLAADALVISYASTDTAP